MTSHEFARKLLAGPDLPIFHFDPSLAGYDEECDTSISQPAAGVVRHAGNGQRQYQAFITICGTANEHYEKDREITIAVRVLNEAFEADPVAMAALINTRTPCNAKLLDHPTIQCSDTDVGPLGIINGIVDRICGARVAAQFTDETPESLTGFAVYKPTA